MRWPYRGAASTSIASGVSCGPEEPHALGPDIATRQGGEANPRWAAGSGSSPGARCATACAATPPGSTRSPPPGWWRATSSSRRRSATRPRCCAAPRWRGWGAGAAATSRRTTTSGCGSPPAGRPSGNLPVTLLDWREGAGRLTRTDPRYGLDRHVALKCAALASGPLRGRHEVALWGAGETGRAFADGLLRAGIRVTAFVEVDRKKVGRTIRGAPVHHFEEVGRLRGLPLLVAVGAAGARELIRRRAGEARLRGAARLPLHRLTMLAPFDPGAFRRELTDRAARAVRAVRRRSAPSTSTSSPSTPAAPRASPGCGPRPTPRRR